MKRKTVQMILSLTLTAAMCFGAPAAAFAKEAAATEETADQTSENTDEADSEKEKTCIIQLDGYSLRMVLRIRQRDR